MIAGPISGTNVGAEQQSVLMLHRARDLLVRQRTMLINALRGHCGEFGMVVAQGASKVTILIEMIEDRDDARLPALAREALGCPSSKQMGLLSVFHKGGSGSSLFDVKPLGVDGSSGGFGWSVF